MPTQTVVIDFQADFSGITSAVDELAKAGKVDADLAAQFKKANTEIKNQGAALDKAAASANKDSSTFGKLADLMKQFPKTGLNRFLLQVGNELAGAGIKADDFFNKTKTGSAAAVKGSLSLKAELRQVREQMQQAALAGGVLGEEYKRLKQRAGELDDTIKDVASDIANAGSDTQGIDNVIGSVAALAGGFSVVQGAQALFGDESEDVQKALLKVNAAMAIATGLQQVMAAVTKQGALVRVADAAATNLQTAAQRIYTFVTGRATAATVGFKIALAATGILFVVAAVLALAEAFKSSTKDVDDATEAIDRQNRSLEQMSELLDRQTSIAVARAGAMGKSESDIIRINGKALQQKSANLRQVNLDLAAQRAGLDQTSEAYGLLNKQIDKNNELIQGIDTDVIIAGFNLEKQLADDRKKASDDAIAKAKEAADKANAAAAKARAAGFADFKAGIELQLLEVEKGSLAELALRKKLANAQLQIDLEGDNLTNNQRKLLIQKFFKEKKDLEKKFNSDIIAISIEGEKNRLQAVLANLSISNEERLNTTIEFLQQSAAAEIESAEGNASKILLINAQLNAAIAAAKIDSIKKSAADEASILESQGGSSKRALDAVASNEKMKADVRINAIRQLAERVNTAIDKEIQANRDANAVKGADNRSLEVEYEGLLDKKKQAAEATEKQITDIELAEGKRRQDNNIAFIQATIGGLQQLSEIASGIQSNQEQAATAAIDSQRDRVDELLKAGAISEKEAAIRNKRIDAEERAAKNRAAIQQKKLAVFNALLQIPQAFIAGLTAPFPIGGPIYGAILAGLAAIQAGIVASRPVPKFATGKKGSYSGLGIAGEAGAELIHRADGSMEVATKRSLVYVGSRDKIFTASETKNMMPFVNKEAIAFTGLSGAIDYDKMAKAVGNGKGKSPVVNVDNTEVGQEMINALLKNEYMNKYYRSK